MDIRLRSFPLATTAEARMVSHHYVPKHFRDRIPCRHNEQSCPPGSDSLPVYRNMATNSRRVRWLSANNSQ